MAEARAEVAAAVSANEGLQPPLDYSAYVRATSAYSLFFSICYFCLFAGRRPPALRQLVRSHQLSPCCAVATVIA